MLIDTFIEELFEDGNTEYACYMSQATRYIFDEEVNKSAKNLGKVYRQSSLLVQNEYNKYLKPPQSFVWLELTPNLGIFLQSDEALHKNCGCPGVPELFHVKFFFDNGDQGENLNRYVYQDMYYREGKISHPYEDNGRLSEHEEKLEGAIVDAINGFLLLLHSKLATAVNSPVTKRKSVSLSNNSTYRLRTSFDEHKTLQLNLPSQPSNNFETESANSGRKHKLHLVRGHFKIKKHGIYWWAPFWRGDQSLGTVTKDYNCQLTEAV